MKHLDDFHIRWLSAFILVFGLAGCDEQGNNSELESELKRLALRAEQVTIIRDQFGVPHIYGKTDADADHTEDHEE